MPIRCHYLVVGVLPPKWPYVSPLQTVLASVDKFIFNILNFFCCLTVGRLQAQVVYPEKNGFEKIHFEVFSMLLSSTKAQVVFIFLRKKYCSNRLDFFTVGRDMPFEHES